MARYTGPKAKIGRKFGEAILGAAKYVQKKNYGPGQHGRGRRKKQSEYSVQLAAKQKVKYIYGVLEKQFRKTFAKAASLDGVTGVNLLQLLESRLDNVVYRLGIAPSRRAARQLVSHKHILVNGAVLNIPSYSVRPGDLISVREKSKNIEAITVSLSGRSVSKFNWMEWEKDSFTGKFITYPDRDSIPENVQEQLIVELYSK